MEKYRYVIYSMFKPENTSVIPSGCHPKNLGITIPSPIVRNSVREVKIKGNLVCNFGYLNGEPVIWFFILPEFWEPRMVDGYLLRFYKQNLRRKRHLDGPVVQPMEYYNYEKFKSTGGNIYGVPLKTFDPSFEAWNSDDYLVDVDFKTLFPSMHKDSDFIYIDNQVYEIQAFDE